MTATTRGSRTAPEGARRRAAPAVDDADRAHLARAIAVGRPRAGHDRSEPRRRLRRSPRRSRGRRGARPRRPVGPTPRWSRSRPRATRRPGATASSRLEPCAHHGRTPPCTDALVAAGVRSRRRRAPRPQRPGRGRRRRAAPRRHRRWTRSTGVLRGAVAGELEGFLTARHHAVARTSPSSWPRPPDGAVRPVRRPVDHRPVGAPGRPPLAGRGRRASWSAAAPCSPTTRGWTSATSPSATGPSPDRSSSTRRLRTPPTARGRRPSARSSLTRPTRHGPRGRRSSRRRRRGRRPSAASADGSGSTSPRRCAPVAAATASPRARRTRSHPRRRPCSTPTLVDRLVLHVALDAATAPPGRRRPGPRPAGARPGSAAPAPTSSGSESVHRRGAQPDLRRRPRPAGAR